MLPTPHNEPAAPEVPQRRFRKLRIAWSVGWGLAAVLLLVLWVRSYWWRDFYVVRLSAESYHGMISDRGVLFLGEFVEWFSPHTFQWLSLRSTSKFKTVWQLLPGLNIDSWGNIDFGTYPAFLCGPAKFSDRGSSLATMAESFQPPRSANRHDARGRRARADRVD